MRAALGRRPLPPGAPAADRGGGAGARRGRAGPRGGRAGIVRAVVALAPASLPRIEEAALDVPVLAFAAGTGFLASLAFGALPALQISRAGVASVLGETARGGVGGRAVARRVLVAAQVAIAVVLLAGAGLLLKSYARLQSMPAGFDPESMPQPAAQRRRRPAISGRDEVTAFFATAARRRPHAARRASAGAANGLPLAVDGRLELRRRGTARVGSKHSRSGRLVRGDARLFRDAAHPARARPAAGLRRRGRDTAPVIFLNEAAARQFFADDGSDRPPRDPPDQHHAAASSPGAGRGRRGGRAAPRPRAQRPRPEMYLPHAQFLHFSPGAQARALSLVVRTDRRR